MKSKFNMKMLFVLTLIFQVIIINAQSVSFTYDEAGNRLTRALNITKINEKVDDAGLDTTNLNNSDLDLQNLVLSNNNNPIINVNPNPTYGLFNVEISTDSPNIKARIHLFSINGNQIYSNNNASKLTSIDISDKEAGTYILSVVVNGVKESWKIVKQ